MQERKEVYDIGEYFEFRNIFSSEAGQAVRIEDICFPPNEACSEKMMLKRAAKAPEPFPVAVDRESGEIAGFKIVDILDDSNGWSMTRIP